MYDIEQVRKELIEWETTPSNRENLAYYEARAKELRDLLSLLNGAYKEGLEIGRKEGLEIGRKEGLEIGRKEAREQVLPAVAEELLKNGMTVDQVAKYVELPLEMGEEIKKSL